MTVAADSLLDIALAAHDTGLCVIPVRADGSKRPCVAWKQYQAERPTREQVEAWFGVEGHQAAAVVCGTVSGGLVMVEMEGPFYAQGRWQAFRDRCVTALGEDRWRQITAYVELSPSGGPHLLLRCPDQVEPVGNVKLAHGLVDGAVLDMMETRGEGGYVIIGGSTGHASGKDWTVAQGCITDVATVTPAELHTILDAARALDEVPPSSPVVKPEPLERPPRPAPSGHGWMDAVIEAFNDAHRVAEYLPGWSWAADDTYRGEPVVRLRRDGSDNPHGAVVFRSGRVGFFSSNAPAGCDHYDGTSAHIPTYDAFTLALLERGGRDQAEDRVAFARQLRSDGYGPQPVHEPAEVPQIALDGPAVATSAATPAEDGQEPQEAPVSAVRVFWADEVAQNPPAPLEELVTNLVSVGEVTVFGAPRAMGKTWATMGLAAAVAEGGGALFGSDCFRVVRPARVAYLQGELGLAASHVRWNLATGGQPPHVAEIFDRLRVRSTSTRVTVNHDGVTTTEEQSHAIIDHRLEPLLAELGVELLVIDPWATYFSGNENSNDEVESAIDALTQMARRVGCAVWIVHHITAKAAHGNLAEPEDLWRGASRLADAVATRVTLLPHYTPAKARELGLDRFAARTFGDLHVLQRNGPPVPLVHTRLDQFQWRAWEPTNPDGGRPSTLSDRDIVNALRAGPITSKRKLMDALEVGSHSTLDRHLERLVELGIVAIDDGPNRSKVYRLVDDGGLP